LQGMPDSMMISSFRPKNEFSFREEGCFIASPRRIHSGTHHAVRRTNHPTTSALLILQIPLILSKKETLIPPRYYPAKNKKNSDMIDMMNRIEKQKMISRLFSAKIQSFQSCLKIFVFLCFFAADLLQQKRRPYR